ncbi:MAG: TonB-dependent receptor domain-containing protein [Psychrobium sp.]
MGLKASLFDQRMTIDTALFHVDIKDQQLQALVVVDDVPFSAIDNAGESHTQGIEFSMTAQLSDTVKFDADIGYTKSEFDEYIDATGTDRQGDAFPYVPETTASFGFEYANEILDGVELNLRASHRYVDNYFIGTGAAFDPKFEIDSYDLVNLRATFAKDDWEVSVYVDNVTDEYVIPFLSASLYAAFDENAA